MVEGPAFRKLAELLEPRYKVPSRTYFSETVYFMLFYYLCAKVTVFVFPYKKEIKCVFLFLFLCLINDIDISYRVSYRDL